MSSYKLKELRIYSSYCQWECGDLTETYKLLNVHYDIDWTKIFTLSNVQNTSGYHMKLYKKLSKLQLRKIKLAFTQNNHNYKF